MYSIQSGYGIAVNPSALWGDAADVQTITGVQLYAKYREMYLTLKVTGVNTQIRVDVFKQVPTIKDDTRTLADIFGTWDNTKPLVNEVLPTYIAKKAVYFDAAYAGLRVDATTRGGTATSSNDPNDLVDLLISRPLTDMVAFHKRCLVNVNGFFYRNLLSGQNLVVPDAAKSLRSNNSTLCGLLSFEEIGDIEMVGITEADVLPKTAGQPLNDGVLFKLPEHAVGKSVLIVIGGYLHLASWDKYFHYVNEQTIGCDTYRLRLEQRYAESAPFLDMGFQRPDGTESDLVIDGAYLRSDEALMKLFTMDQSFFVIVDTPRLRSVTSSLHSLTRPGRFFSHQKEPKYLVVQGAGKTMNYWKVHEAGIWGIHGPVIDAAPSIDTTPRSSDLASLHFHWSEPYGAGPACVLDIIADQVVAP